MLEFQFRLCWVISHHHRGLCENDCVKKNSSSHVTQYCCTLSLECVLNVTVGSVFPKRHIQARLRYFTRLYLCTNTVNQIKQSHSMQRFRKIISCKSCHLSSSSLSLLTAGCLSLSKKPVMTTRKSELSWAVLTLSEVLAWSFCCKLTHKYQFMFIRRARVYLVFSYSAHMKLYLSALAFWMLDGW